MREIKFLGTYRKEGISRSYQYSLFECPECGSQVEKIRKDGIKQKYCSHKCYAANRERRGAYKEYVMISGYRYIQCPDHPSATKKGYVAEHRLVAMTECFICLIAGITKVSVAGYYPAVYTAILTHWTTGNPSGNPSHGRKRLKHGEQGGLSALMLAVANSN